MTSVLVGAGIRLYREGLAQILDATDGFAVTDVAADAEEAVALATRSRPDIVLLDMSMEGSLEAVRRLASREVRVVALAVPEHEREIVDCAEAGVAGFVTRDNSLADLVAALESVARGEVLCSPKLAATLLRRVTTLASARTAGPAATLTARELEIVELIDQGLANKEIAHRLRVELSTVKNHVHNILEKLGAQRRSEAAAILRGRLPVPGASRD